MPNDKLKRAISVALSFSILASAPQIGNADLAPINGRNSFSPTPPPGQFSVFSRDSTGNFSMRSFEAKISNALKPSRSVEAEKIMLKVLPTATNMIDIRSNNSDLNIKLKPGEKFVTAKELLGEEFDTGEVFVINSDNMITKIIIPNSFDDFKNWGGCVLAVSGLTADVASIFLPAAKLVKVKKAIKWAGNAYKFIKIGVSIFSNIKLRANIEVPGFVKEAFDILFGIDDVVSKCKFIWNG